MISWTVSQTEEAFGFVSMRATITVKAQGGVDELANMGSRYYQAVRQYRVRLLNGTGVEPFFPIWTTPEETPNLARQMLDVGLRTVLTCVDSKQLDKTFVGREFDEKLLADLPSDVDPCGERGEFHTFCCQCPEFSTDIPVTVGDVVEQEGFWFADLCPVVIGGS